VRISIKLAVAAVTTLSFFAQSHAQAPKAKNAPATAQAAPAPAAAAEGANAPAPPGWIARCSSANRSAPLECAIEQTAVLTKTGQLIVLPAGAKLQVDDGKTSDLQIQTCEARGCYANLQIAPEMLTALKSGKQLKVSFQNLAKETIAIPMPLADFAAAYEKIK
jgi:invasion protein IalB